MSEREVSLAQQGLLVRTGENLLSPPSQQMTLQGHIIQIEFLFSSRPDCSIGASDELDMIFIYRARLSRVQQRLCM